MDLPERIARRFTVFELRGKTHHFHMSDPHQARKQTDAGWETTTQPFRLDQGLMLLRVHKKEHKDIKVELSRVRSGFPAPLMLLPPALLLGGVVGGTLSMLGSGFLNSDNRLFDTQWPTPGWSLKAAGPQEMAYVVMDGFRRAPRPGEEYQLKVTAKEDWRIDILQPELRQIRESIPFRVVGQEAGIYLIGPIQSESRPVLSKARHYSRGPFYARSMPLDGTHECEDFVTADGQTFLEDCPTGMRPGKEYIIEIGSGGNWELELYEGY